jgi:hypothetical protein
MPTPKQEFESIDPSALTKVAGGASRTTKGGDSEVTAALAAIQDSLKDLAGSKNNSGMDPMQMILIMMMMGGMGGGGGGGGYAIGAGHTPPVINVDTGVVGGGGCGRGGKKGW